MLSDPTDLPSHVRSQQDVGQVFGAVYQELKNLAHQQMMLERPDNSLHATALVHELYIRLAGTSPEQWHSSQHFFAMAAKAMRQILVDHARARNAVKRGARFERKWLDDVSIAVDRNGLDLIALDEALTELELEDARKAMLVELRFFSGLSLKEAAEFLGISPATAKRDWVYARAWLYGKIYD